MSNRPTVQIIKPPNTLMKAKISSGRATLGTDAIERAEAAIKTIGDDFPNWAQRDLDELDKALATARTNPNQQEDLITEIFRGAMELKGQGGSFGYDLISQVGDSLKQFTDGRTEANSRDVEIIAAHLDAMRRVMANNIKGDGGNVGRAIVDGLHKLTSSI